MTTLDQSPLGKATAYADSYNPSLLHALARSGGRPDGQRQAPFGEDIWTGYEFSWLNTRGKPEVAGLRIRVPASSTHMVESKSVKLYLNAFAQTRFGTPGEVQATIDSDLRLAVRAPIEVALVDIGQLGALPHQLPGTCLDGEDIAVNRYQPDASLLAAASDTVVHEALYTHLFRSVCPVTGQPDWATVWLDYRGPALDRAALLAYLVSFRRHAGFHEATIEQVFADLLDLHGMQSLSVLGLFQRRGGVDIQPYRSTEPEPTPLYRTPRQ